MSAAPLAAEIKSDRAWRPSHNPWLVAMTVTLATFMEVLDIEYRQRRAAAYRGRAVGGRR